MAPINGTPSNDNLTGTSDSDTIFGDLGDDTLDGSGGADTFVFNNVINNFPALNSLYVYSTDGFDIIRDFNNNSEGDSVITIDPTTNNSKYVDIRTDVRGNVFIESAGSGRTEYIFGTTNSDTINGTSADDVIRSSSGNDIVYGKDGNDSLYGETGNDSLYGGADSDKLYGGLGNDYLSDRDDFVDELYGGAGNDILDEGSSFDILIGGTGDDTYIVVGFLGDRSNTPLTEKLNQGTDTVESSGSYKLGDNLENLVLTGSSDINGSGNALDNRIEGNAGQNFLVGGDGNDHLLGYGGNDILAGEAGNDTVSGGAGNDFLNGGAGSDTLTGGGGSDTLTGGAGADRFVFSSPSDGIDIIKDFRSVESDKIQISKTGFGATSTNQFSYNNNTGALSFQETQFATLENKPSFIPNLHIELV